jgi:Putative Actinobacterial Holin-X, holin superfamily III
MPIQGTNGQVSLGAAVKQVTEHASALFRLEIELAQLEVKRKVVALAVGIVLTIAAAVFGLFALGFLLATIAAALSTVMATWLALLIVGVGLLLLAGVLGWIGMSRIQKGAPPVPELAIQEAKVTQTALRSE